MLGDLTNFCAAFQSFGARSLAEQSFNFEVLPGIELHGRIDRVDRTDSGGAVIVDYKYSKDTRQNVNDDTKVQGVLYTIAAERVLGLKPQATIFLSVKKEQKPVGWGKLAGYDLPPITSEWLQKGLEMVGRVTGEI